MLHSYIYYIVTFVYKLTFLLFSSIEPRDASLDISVLHKPPVLVAELYQMKMKIVNNEKTQISDVR